MRLRPFVAILLSLLPNVETLRLSIGQQDCNKDQLDRLLASPNYFTKLRESKIRVRSRGTADTISSLSNLKSHFLLPDLQKLSIRIEDQGVITGGPIKVFYESSGVRGLTMTSLANADLTYRALSFVVRIPISLVRLSLALPMVDYSSPFDNQLWQTLSDHKNILEYLDIFRRYPQKEGNFRYRTQEPSIMKQNFLNLPAAGSLRDFIRLKKLRITPELLLGGRSTTSPELKDRVPHSLQSLTIYNGLHLYQLLKLHSNLYQVLNCGFFTKLIFFILERVSKCGPRSDRVLRFHSTPLNDMCADRGIIFCIVNRWGVPAGGTNRRSSSYVDDLEDLVAREWEKQTKSTVREEQEESALPPKVSDRSKPTKSRIPMSICRSRWSTS